MPNSKRPVVRENYNVKQACDIKISWEDLIDPELCEAYPKRTTTRIYKEYVKEFKESLSSPRNAMVLYGPPGTSKTTLAQCIAKELEWRLVTITPSDFVKTGIESSEHMARELFENLLRVRKVVVLFDEIDEMLRSRSEKSNAQSASGISVDVGAAQRSVETAAGGIGILRFLIPGMLPKLQDLKQYGEKHELILIIATNYKERLDKAIVRPGRIDDLFLVTPPDSQARSYWSASF
jgi:transitional endoplasmic reticulum ATPase